MAIAGILKHINAFLQPGFLLDMMVKAMILYVVSVYMSEGVARLFDTLPYFKDDVSGTETMDKLKKWVQVLVQVAVCAPVAFLLRAVIEYLGNKYDLLDEVMSPKSAAGASLIAGMAFFLRQSKLSERMKALDLGFDSVEKAW
jgi:phosphate/sulfate permease